MSNAYFELAQQYPGLIANVGNSFAQTFLAAQAAKRQQQQLELAKTQQEQEMRLRDQAEKRRVAEEQKLTEQQKTIATLRKGVASGDVAAMQQLAQLNPEDPMLAAIQKGQTGELERANAAKKTQRDAEIADRNYQLELRKLALEKQKANTPKEPKDGATPLRDKFLALQDSKDMRMVATAYKKMATSSDSGVGDLSLIYGFIKLIDPGSVVREGEVHLTAEAGSAAQEAAGWFKRIKSGGRLPPTLRSQYLDEAKNILGAQYSSYEPIANEYRRLATKAGADPDDVVLPLGVEGMFGSKNTGSAQPSAVDLPQGWSVVQ
jgi:hypothetical protein